MTQAPNLQLAAPAKVGRDTTRARRAVVFAWHAAQLSRVHTPVCRYLKRRYDTDTVYFTHGPLPNRSVFDFDPSEFAEIVDLRQHFASRAASETPEPADLARMAAEVEGRMGILLNDILRTDRHLGIGFVSGARFMRSRFGANRSYWQNLDLIIRLFRVFEAKLDQYEPLCVLATPGTVGSTTLIAAAAARGVPMRGLYSSRSGTKFYWSETWLSNPIGFFATHSRNLAREAGIRETAPAPPEQLVSLRAQAGRESFRRNAGVAQVLRSLARTLRTHVASAIRRDGNTYGAYTGPSRLWAVVERWWWRRRTLRERPVLPTLPAGIPFVFFPLHIEPESTLMVEAQMCDDQLTLIDWLAKNVPSGWLVVVKEHPSATAPRSKGFWDRIRGLPNVRVAATLEDGMQLASLAQAVAVIGGTLGMQAAMAAKPVITFRPDYMALAMPHVYLARSYEETRAALQRIANGDVALQDRIRAARAFARTLEETGFQIDDPELRRGIPGKDAVGAADVARICDTLMESLPARVAAAAESRPAAVAAST